MSVTDQEIEEAIRDAWTILHGGSTAPPSARRLAAALLALTKGTPPHWATPDDLWRDRLAILAEQGAWLAIWGPRPGETGCQVPPAVLPEAQRRRENAYALWRSEVRTSIDEVAAEDKATAKRASRSRRQDSAEKTSLGRPRIRRVKSPAQESDSR
jgi:hypothetical protein